MGIGLALIGIVIKLIEKPNEGLKVPWQPAQYANAIINGK